jgi:trimethylamine--corrinoid protein Co-methyltransferase
LPVFRLLDRYGIGAIHEAALEVLEGSGVMVKNEGALELLRGAGCPIEGNITRLPLGLVEECLGRAPSSFELHTRDGEGSRTVGGDNVVYNPGSAAIYFMDRESGEMRRAVARDLVELVRLTDALENIHAQSTAMVPSDVPDGIADLYRLQVILKNSTKPMITGAFTKRGLIDMKEMLEAVAGGSEELRETPRGIFDCCPSSPLMWSDVTCQNLIDCAEAGIPAEIIPAPQMGATSPVTIGGTLVLSAAEFLSGVVISQLVEPGAPVVFGGSPSAFDMRYCTARLGAVEAVMAACAFAELGKHYGVPTHGYLGLSDSKVVDAQSGYEAGLGITLAALTGVNIVSGPGMLACENCQSLEKLVIDNDLCGAAYRLLEGVDLEEDALAPDLISKVGPGGHFLAEKHTREHLRREQFMPSKVICRLTPDAWRKEGSKDSLDRARERVTRTLREHHPWPLPEDSERRLDEVFKGILKRHGIPHSSLPPVG